MTFCGESSRNGIMGLRNPTDSLALGGTATVPPLYLGGNPLVHISKHAISPKKTPAHHRQLRK